MKLDVLLPLPCTRFGVVRVRNCVRVSEEIASSSSVERTTCVCLRARSITRLTNVAFSAGAMARYAGSRGASFGLGGAATLRSVGGKYVASRAEASGCSGAGDEDDDVGCVAVDDDDPGCGLLCGRFGGLVVAAEGAESVGAGTRALGPGVGERGRRRRGGGGTYTPSNLP